MCVWFFLPSTSPPYNISDFIFGSLRALLAGVFSTSSPELFGYLDYDELPSSEKRTSLTLGAVFPRLQRACFAPLCNVVPPQTTVFKITRRCVLVSPLGLDSYSTTVPAFSSASSAFPSWHLTCVCMSVFFFSFPPIVGRSRYGVLKEAPDTSRGVLR